MPHEGVLDDRLEFLRRLADAVAVRRVYHKNERVCVVEVVAPQRAQLLLPAHIPHREHHVFVLHFLDLCACSGGARVRQ